MLKSYVQDRFPDSIDAGLFFLLLLLLSFHFLSVAVMWLVRSALFLSWDRGCGTGSSARAPPVLLPVAIVREHRAPPIILGLRLLLWARGISWQVDWKRSFPTESSPCLQTVLDLFCCSPDSNGLCLRPNEIDCTCSPGGRGGGGGGAVRRPVACVMF